MADNSISAPCEIVTRQFSGGQVTVVDAQDADLLTERRLTWAGHYVRGPSGYLHRQVAERMFGPLPKKICVDHIDGDRLNNRRSNIRMATPLQNAANKVWRTGKSQYRGVFQTTAGSWAAQITKAGKTRCLGTFTREEDAAAAYDAAAIDLHGEFAKPNLGRAIAPEEIEAARRRNGGNATCRNGHPVNDANSYLGKNGKRVCRVCSLAACHRSRARKRAVLAGDKGAP